MGQKEDNREAGGESARGAGGPDDEDGKHKTPCQLIGGLFLGIFRFVKCTWLIIFIIYYWKLTSDLRT